MEYFCAECQCKHNSEEISLDIWNIMRSKISDNIRSLMMPDNSDNELPVYNSFSKLRNAEQKDKDVVSKVHMALSQYIRYNGDYDSSMRKKFMTGAASYKNKIAKTINVNDKNVRICTIKGIKKMSLGELLNYYKHMSNPSEEELKLVEQYEKIVGEDILKMDIYSQIMTFYFSRCDRESFTIDKVTDENNVPLREHNQNGDEDILRNEGMASTPLGAQRFCPHCGKRLPAAAGRAKEIVISLFGAPRAGKSSIITSIASALRSGRYAERYSLSMKKQPYDDNWTRLEEEIEKFDKCMKVTKTPIGISDVPAYSIALEVNNCARVLTFVDMPGEFFTDSNALHPQFLRNYAGIFEHTDCIWFVISKLSLEGYDFGEDIVNIQEKIDLVKNPALRAKLTEFNHSSLEFEAMELLDEVLDNMGQTSDIEEKLNLEAMSRWVLRRASSEADQNNKHINAQDVDMVFREIKRQIQASGSSVPPMAVIVSKPELYTNYTDKKITHDLRIYPTMEADSSQKNITDLNNLTKITGGRDRTVSFNEKEYCRMVKDIRDYIKEKNPGMLSALESNCSRICYIAAAAYGKTALDPGIISTKKPAPYHEIVPLFWTLAICGGFPVYHEIMKVKRSFLGGMRNSEPCSEPVRFDYRRCPSDNRMKVIYDDIRENLFDHPERYKQSIINN